MNAIKMDAMDQFSPPGNALAFGIPLQLKI